MAYGKIECALCIARRSQQSDIPNTRTGPQDDNIPETCSVPNGAGGLSLIMLITVDSDNIATIKKKALADKMTYGVLVAAKERRRWGSIPLEQKKPPNLT